MNSAGMSNWSSFLEAVGRKFSHRPGNTAKVGVVRWPSGSDTAGCRLRRFKLTAVYLISMDTTGTSSLYHSVACRSVIILGGGCTRSSTVDAIYNDINADAAAAASAVINLIQTRRRLATPPAYQQTDNL